MCEVGIHSTGGVRRSQKICGPDVGVSVGVHPRGRGGVSYVSYDDSEMSISGRDKNKDKRIAPRKKKEEENKMLHDPHPSLHMQCRVRPTNER